MSLTLSIINFRYKWAFVGRPELSQNEENPVEFVPHVLRIARIMETKVN